MIGHLRVKSPLSQLGIFLGLFGAAFILGSLLMAIVVVAKGLPVNNLDKMDWTQPGVLSTMKLVQALSSVLIFLLPAYVFAMLSFQGRPGYFLGLKPAQKYNMYVLAVVCVLSSFPMVFWLGEFNQSLPLPQWMTGMEKDASKQMEAFLKADTKMDLFINVIVIAMLPAICEEICFRGALQRILIQLFRNPWIGIIVTAALFSALHLQFQGFLPRMFLGVILGALYWYSGSLWTSILAHFVANAVQVIAVSYTPKYVNENPSVPVFMGLLSAVAVFALIWAFRKLSTVTYSGVYETDELNRNNQFLA